MGHSTQEYHGKYKTFNDGQLLVVLGFALRIISEKPSYENLTELSQHWRYSMDSYGTGMIDLKVEELVKTPEQKRAFIDLLDEVKHQALGYRDKIPVSTLSKLVLVSGIIFFKDLPPSFIVEMVDKLKEFYILSDQK